MSIPCVYCKSSQGYSRHADLQSVCNPCREKSDEVAGLPYLMIKDVWQFMKDRVERLRDEDGPKARRRMEELTEQKWILSLFKSRADDALPIETVDTVVYYGAQPPLCLLRKSEFWRIKTSHFWGRKEACESSYILCEEGVYASWSMWTDLVKMDLTRTAGLDTDAFIEFIGERRLNKDLIMELEHAFDEGIRHARNT
jgi:hypothetical protein